MNRRMLKYRIALGQEQTTIAIRAGAVIRAIEKQRPGDLCLWAEVPDDHPVITRTFRVIPTGGDVPDPGRYVGTVFDAGFVWHVYELAEVADLDGMPIPGITGDTKEQP